MGFWKKLAGGLRKGIGVAVEVAPVLPIPEKAKRIVLKVGETERDVEAIADEFKKGPSTPTKPAA